MTYKTQVKLTNMCMIYDDSGQVLVQDRTSSDWPGVTFPGGKIEPDESLVDSVVREVKEETGLNVRSLQLCGIKDWIFEDGSRYMLLMYKTNDFDGKIKASSEGSVYWVKMSKLKGLDLAKDMKKMLDIFTKDHLSEFYYYQENGNWKYKLK